MVAPVYAGAGVYTYTDREVPAGIVRKYRGRTVINDPDNYNSSLYSATSALTTASIPPVDWWVLLPEALSADWTATQLRLKVNPGATLEHTQRVSTNLPLDGTQRGAIATRTRPRARQRDVEAWVLNEADYLTLMKIIDDGRTMWISDVIGRGMYVNLKASPTEETLRSGGVGGTPYPMRHGHRFTISIVEVRRPPVADRLDIG